EGVQNSRPRATEEPARLDQERPRAGPCGCDGSGRAGRPPTDDHDIAAPQLRHPCQLVGLVPHPGCHSAVTALSFDAVDAADRPRPIFIVLKITTVSILVASPLGGKDEPRQGAAPRPSLDGQAGGQMSKADRARRGVATAFLAA